MRGVYYRHKPEIIEHVCRMLEIQAKVFYILTTPPTVPNILTPPPTVPNILTPPHCA